MPHKVTMFFEMGPFGWSESYWNITNDTQLALSRGVLLAGARADWLPAAGTVTYIRASDPTIFRDALVEAQGFPGSKNLAFDPSEFPVVCWLMRFETQNPSAYGRMFCRGVISQTGGNGNRQNINAVQVTRSGAWISMLQDPVNQWAIRNNNPALQPVPIFAVGPIVAGATQLSTTAPHMAVPGDRIRLSRIQTVGAVADPNGIYRVMSVPDPQGLTISPTIPQFASCIGGTGSARPLRPVYTQIFRTKFVRVTKHDTGRPFDSPRGRSQVR